MASAYLWLKAAHIIAVVAWMAGLFYLPRLFVYHAGAETESQLSQVFKTMEHRLYMVIMWPAMIAAWLTGAALVSILWDSGIAGSRWAWVKLGAVVAMTALHVQFGWHVRQFRQGANRQGSRYFRFLNEAPTLLLIVIVIMVVVKPL